jgi:hypothetical protein
MLKQLPAPDSEMLAAGLEGRWFLGVGNHEVWGRSQDRSHPFRRALSEKARRDASASRFFSSLCLAAFSSWAALRRQPQRLALNSLLAKSISVMVGRRSSADVPNWYWLTMRVTDGRNVEPMSGPLPASSGIVWQVRAEYRRTGRTG